MKWKQTIRTKISSVLVLFFSLSLAAQDVKEELGNFSELKTFNAVEVEVIPSESNRIEITGHSKNDVKFNIVEDRLEIRLSLDNLWSKNNTRITLYVNDLRTIDANEGSHIEVSGELKGEELTFRTQEGASIAAEVNSRRICAKAVSAGKITLEGKAEEQEVDINTGGLYFGRNLRTQRTEVSAGTAGKGEVNASEYVKATAKLGGTVEIFGRPDEIDKKTSLGGRIL